MERLTVNGGGIDAVISGEPREYALRPVDEPYGR